MGHHYVPQEYLRGFADPENPGKIWMYDKQSCQFTHASIKSVAQEAGYYSETTERQLSELVEGPAHQVLKKLRLRYKIDNSERIRLALYVGTMLMRVPRRRRKAFQMLPGVLEETINNISNQVDQWARTTTVGPELISRRYSELEQASKKYRTKPPTKIIEMIRTPWPTLKEMACLSTMTWQIVSSESDEFFVTSDNPAYFFEAYGLGNPQSELTFALASDLMLFASRQGAHHETIFTKTNPAIKREANRRIASGAERFVFCRAQEDWVAKIANKQKPYLSRIQW
jgi:AraC-like DNA-binding protein